MSRKLIPGKNDLAILRPDLAKEWNERNLPLCPEQVTCGSTRKVWWRCAAGQNGRRGSIHVRVNVVKGVPIAMAEE